MRWPPLEIFGMKRKRIIGDEIVSAKMKASSLSLKTDFVKPADAITNGIPEIWTRSLLQEKAVLMRDLSAALSHLQSNEREQPAG
jgi:hypothetical protein